MLDEGVSGNLGSLSYLFNHWHGLAACGTLILDSCYAKMIWLHIIC